MNDKLPLLCVGVCQLMEVMMKRSRKIIALVMSLFVFFGCMSVLTVNTDAASTKTLYVVDKVVSNSGGMKETTTYKYKNGIIVKYNRTMKDGSSTYHEKFNMTLNKKYRPVKSTFSDYYGNSGTQEYVLDGKGRVKKLKTTYESLSYKYNSKGYFFKITQVGNKYYWDSKGRVTKIKDKFGTTSKFTYDRKGNVLTSNEDGTTYDFVNTYNSKGRLSKVEKYYESDKQATTTFTYKKAKVPSSQYKKALAQQRWIRLQVAAGQFTPPLEGIYK